MFSFFSKKTKIQPVVNVRKFSKCESPTQLSKTEVVKIPISPKDVSLPIHGGKHKKLRKSPAVRS
jgi:hypothetical protein